MSTHGIRLCRWGSLGAVHVGMLHSLAEQNVRLWCGLIRRQIMPMRLRDLLRVATRRAYIVDPSALRRLLERYLPYRLLEQATIPMHVLATDMVLGTERLLSSGSVVDAVMASTANPRCLPAGAHRRARPHRRRRCEQHADLQRGPARHIRLR